MPPLDKLLQLLDADPNDPFTLYAIAQEHGKRGNPAEALAFYDRCLAADPAYCYAFYHKARLLDSIDRRPDALAVARAGLEAAVKARDEHAASELRALIDELE